MSSCICTAPLVQPNPHTHTHAQTRRAHTRSSRLELTHLRGLASSFFSLLCVSSWLCPLLPSFLPSVLPSFLSSLLSCFLPNLLLLLLFVSALSMLVFVSPLTSAPLAHCHTCFSSHPCLLLQSDQ